MINEGKCLAMPIVITFAINKNKKAITAAHENYINEGLTVLNQKYNVIVDETGSVNIENLSEEERKEYIAELNKLQDVEVEVEIQKVTQEDFRDYNPTLTELDILSFMIEI